MIKRYLSGTLAILMVNFIPGLCQEDKDPPASPVFNRVTVDHATGNTELFWSLSVSPDVAGYIVYLYQNGEGYVLDTIYNPAATNYVHYSSGSSYFSESFVVAAIDSSGNVSPLSNELRTIFASTQIDTCNNKILISWNKYFSIPVKVTGYTVNVSINGSGYFQAGIVSGETNSFDYQNFTSDVEYCFVVRAILENNQSSGSNKSCTRARILRPPQWINADFATITNTGDKIFLSFTYDPSSEINLFRLERKSGTSDGFQWIANDYGSNGWFVYTDEKADVLTTNYYRLSAINNCNLPVVTSNIASNMVLTLGTMGDEIKLQWPSYKEWLGDIASYTLFMNTGRGYFEIAYLLPSDTAYTLNYKDIMYDIRKEKVCFLVTAREGHNNPFGIEGVSRSNEACFDILENITVPNLFTPDGDLINDLFRPVLSFTPTSYHLLITNRHGIIFFDTNDPLEAWDGYRNGAPVPQDVYLWFLRAGTPSGKEISRTGTVTLYRSRK
jgi:gliding motility-associated-like protein